MSYLLILNSMFTQIVDKNRENKDYSVKVSGMYLLPNKFDNNGVAERGLTSPQIVNNADNLKDFSSTDFDILNLIEVGAYNVLKPTYLSSMSDMTFADKFQNANLVVNE